MFGSPFDFTTSYQGLFDKSKSYIEQEEGKIGVSQKIDYKGYQIEKIQTKHMIPCTSFEILAYYVLYKKGEPLKTFVVKHGDSSHRWSLYELKKGCDYLNIEKQLIDSKNLEKKKNPDYKPMTMIQEYITDFELKGLKSVDLNGGGYGDDQKISDYIVGLNL